MVLNGVLPKARWAVWAEYTTQFEHAKYIARLERLTLVGQAVCTFIFIQHCRKAL